MDKTSNAARVGNPIEGGLEVISLEEIARRRCANSPFHQFLKDNKDKYANNQSKDREHPNK